MRKPAALTAPPDKMRRFSLSAASTICCRVAIFALSQETILAENLFIALELGPRVCKANFAVHALNPLYSTPVH
jgi:hypothetical protein